jgi:RNA polymerase sigma-70 factor (ECF subfamily)
MFQTDSRLLEAARQGDETSFLALYRRHRTPLFRFAWRLTGSTATAEDVTQECFLALLKGAAYHSAEGSIRGYLFGITRNLAFQRARLSQRETGEEDRETAPEQLEELLAAERSGAVARAVGGLPPLQREALILFEYEELSLEEIAEATGVEVGAVKARLHRARERLRQRLSPLIPERAGRRCS